VTMPQDLGVAAFVPGLRSDEPDAAMQVLGVVPVNKSRDPFAGLVKTRKRPVRVRRLVLQGLEQRLRKWVVVRYGRAAERGCHVKPLERRQHRGTFHRAAVVGVKGQASFLNALVT